MKGEQINPIINKWPPVQIQNQMQNQNQQLKGEVNRLLGLVKSGDEKYQKSLKEMSRIIQANQNLKYQLDEVKSNFMAKLNNALVERQKQYQIELQNSNKKIEELTSEKQTLIAIVERSQVSSGPLETIRHEQHKVNEDANFLFGYQNKETNHHELRRQKIQLKSQIKAKQKELEGMKHQNQMLKEAILKLEKNLEHSINLKQSQAHQLQNLQLENFQLRKQNVSLISQIQELKLKPTSNENNEMHLLNTLKELHAQLQPLRYQIEELKTDQKEEKEKFLKEKAEFQMKLVNKEEEIKFLKKSLINLQDRNSYFLEESRVFKSQKKKIEELTEEKKILQGKLIVYETMEMVARHRSSQIYSERINEFDQRISILLNDEKLGDTVRNASVHQLVTMKAYIMEMDQKLRKLSEENQYFSRKYKSYKEKYGELLNENKKLVNQHYQTTNAYKGKISSYEMLVEKLTNELEMFFNNEDKNISVNQSTSLNSVLNLYEAKIKNMHGEIVQIKKEKDEFQEEILQWRNNQILLKEKMSRFSLENDNLKELLKKYEMEALIRVQNGNIEIEQKKLLGEKTKIIIELEERIQEMRKQHKNDMQRQIELYKLKISRLQSQLEQKITQKNDSTGKQMIINEQNQMINQLSNEILSLERQVSTLKINGESQLLEQNRLLSEEIELIRKDWKNKLQVQATQHNNEVEHIRNLLSQTKTKVEKQTFQFNQKEMIMDSEIKMLNKELEDKRIQIQYLKNNISQLQAGNSNRSFSSSSILERENNDLKIENERIIHEKNRIQEGFKTLQLSHDQLINYIRDKEKEIQSLQHNLYQQHNEISDYNKKIEELNLAMNNFQSKLHIEQLKESGTNGPTLAEIQHLHRVINDFQNQIVFLENELKLQRDHMAKENQNLFQQMQQARNYIDQQALELNEKNDKIHELLNREQETIQIKQIQKLREGAKLYTEENQRLFRTIKQLQEEITHLKRKIMLFSDEQRSNEEILSVIVLTFAEVDALRARIIELQENFNREHELRISALKYFENIPRQGIIHEEIKRLEDVHQSVHQAEKQSQQRLIERTSLIHKPISIERVESQIYEPFVRFGESKEVFEVIGRHDFEGSSPQKRPQLTSNISIEAQLNESSHTPYIMSSNQLRK